MNADAVAVERHPEDYCHRCDGPNISWYTPGAVWDPVMRPDGDGSWKWQEIICPQCFVELAGGGTWALIPRKDDGERWTSADERAAVEAEAARYRDGIAALADRWDGGEDEGVDHVVACQDFACKYCVVVACASDLRALIDGGDQ